LNSFFFVQPHYWDYFIVRNLIRIGKQVTYTVHDYPPHRGEIFPPKFLTKKIAKTATRVIALNNECHQLLLKLNSNTVRSKLPRFFQSSETIQNKIWDVAYVGRIKKYKGLKNLSKAFQLLNTSSLRILVAGRGGLGTTFGAEVHLLNRWLTRDEVINNIRGTRVLVLPYLEATQSGIIELAKAFEVTVVVTPVANLLEQVMDGGIGVIARSHKPHDLADAIMCALAGKAITYEKNPLILALDRFILEDLNHGMDR
jgi:glycosyltransferase involved in cell wall biosynthesis